MADAWGADAATPLSRRCFQLRAEEPYLNDHRPGGVPLLGVAMQMHLLLQAAEDVQPGWAPGIEDFELGQPILVEESESRLVEVSLYGILGGALTASLTSPRDASERTLHARAKLAATPAASASPAPGRAAPLTAPGGWVEAEHIYSVYFHGPAFQVLGRGRVMAEGLEAEPGRSDALQSLPRAARLIEMAMQASGLHDAATIGSLEIPRRIGRLILPRLGGEPAKILVRPGRRAGKDVWVLNADEEVILSLSGYETAPLPFAHDKTGLGRLQQALLGDSDRSTSSAEEIVP